MVKLGLMDKIDPSVWAVDWIVNCQAVGSSEASLKYLAPYVFKIAISDNRIINVQNRRVSFKYKESKSNRWRKISLNVMEFMRRYIHHVLPTGFMKIRYFGFLNPNCAVSLEKISVLIQMAFGFLVKVSKIEIGPSYLPTCSHCGGKLLYRASILAFRVLPAGAG